MPKGCLWDVFNDVKFFATGVGHLPLHSHTWNAMRGWASLHPTYQWFVWLKLGLMWHLPHGFARCLARTDVAAMK